jgi:hypothetical protein
LVLQVQEQEMRKGLRLAWLALGALGILISMPARLEAG